MGNTATRDFRVNFETVMQLYDLPDFGSLHSEPDSTTKRNHPASDDATKRTRTHARTHE